MASSQQQHRCVFVGNIPYDATEEQLIQICEEVGPVVSFRLVVDRETGKPKGYGFCEYKDEETALSARRNLQGYEINGRQLRVDFAENDKGSDRNRDQGRGGPGVAVNTGVTKQYGGPAVSGDSTLHQQIGLPLAVAAASAMARTLGGAQASTSSNLNGPPQQPLLGSDPLTLHLAKMSRSQLIQIVSEMKVLATQNHDLARQLLLVCPQLSKALFQAQIMLGMVAPQMLQLPNIRQLPVPVPQTSVAPIQGNHQIQQSAATNIHGLPPLPPLSTPQNSLVPNQLSAPVQFPTQLRAPTQIGGAQENLVSAPPAAVPHSSALQKPPADTLCGPPVTAVMPLSLGQAPLLQNAGRSGLGSSGHGSQLTIPNKSVQPLASSGPLLPSTGVRKGTSPHPAAVDTNRDAVMAAGDGSRAGRTNRNPNMLPVSSDRNDSLQRSGRPSKLAKLDDGRGLTFSAGGLPVSTASKARLPNTAGAGVIPTSQSLRADDPPSMETQAPQLPAGVDSALLQQVKNLTPEQLSTLPPEQQQQVLQLQKMLR